MNREGSRGHEVRGAKLKKVPWCLSTRCCFSLSLALSLCIFIAGNLIKRELIDIRLSVIQFARAERNDLFACLRLILCLSPSRTYMSNEVSRVPTWLCARRRAAHLHIYIRVVVVGCRLFFRVVAASDARVIYPRWLEEASCISGSFFFFNNPGQSILISLRHNSFGAIKVIYFWRERERERERANASFIAFVRAREPRDSDALLFHYSIIKLEIITELKLFFHGNLVWAVCI